MKIALYGIVASLVMVSSLHFSPAMAARLNTDLDVLSLADDASTTQCQGNAQPNKDDCLALLARICASCNNLADCTHVDPSTPPGKPNTTTYTCSSILPKSRVSTGK